MTLFLPVSQSKFCSANIRIKVTNMNTRQCLTTEETNFMEKILKIWSPLLLFILQILNPGCTRDHLSSLSTGGHDYIQVNLVANTAGFGAIRIDNNIANACGIAISPKGSIWIASNHTGKCVVYDKDGNQAIAPVNTPLNGFSNGASPNGVVYNSTSSFAINSQPAKFIFSTDDGIITGWSSGNATINKADRSSAKSVYKGIAIANDGTGDFIYAADFSNSKIDVFDQAFSYVANTAFEDPTIPAGYAPFNIRAINGMLFVTYAKQKFPNNRDYESGVGNGYVNIFSPDGKFLKRFCSEGMLNAPWGITQAPAEFGQLANAILIGNVGDGRINVFDASGNYKGQLENNGTPISVNGLWDIAFSATCSTQLYFTAGPQEETYGLFGYIKIK